MTKRRGDDRGDRCEADARCRRPTVVHYGAGGLDRWLCQRHYAKLLKRLFPGEPETQTPRATGPATDTQGAP